MSRRGHTLGLTAVLATALIVSAGCSGSQRNKAGSSTPAKQLVLTLAAHDDDEQEWKPFASAVERLSGGSMRIKVRQHWRGTGTRSEIVFERGMVDDVRAGKAQLAVFGARVWDTLGVTNFQALLAPFLVDSVKLERLALETSFAARALRSVRRAGVVGIAIVPGRLRRPLGLTRPLVALADYRGVRIGIRPSRLAEATFRALGARPAAYIPGNITSLEGIEIDSYTASAEGYDQPARELTSNVALWPKPYTIVMNEAAFARLTHAQQQVLMRAGRDAVAPRLPQIVRDQKVGISNICADKLPLVAATPAEVAALRRAVQPVYDRIARNAFTRQWIEEIVQMGASVPPDVARCPGS